MKCLLVSPLPAEGFIEMGGLFYIFYDCLEGPMPWPALPHSHSMCLQPMRVCVKESR